jgi:hypothetical protein
MSPPIKIVFLLFCRLMKEESVKVIDPLQFYGKYKDHITIFTGLAVQVFTDMRLKLIL